MEKELLKAVKAGIQSAMAGAMASYDSPIKKAVNHVLNEHSPEIARLVNEEVVEMLSSSTFRGALKLEIHSKLGKIIVSKFSGELEKKVNELKQDPTTRARITLAINRLIEEV